MISHGLNIPGVKYPVFEQPLGAVTDERFYSIDVNPWLSGRGLTQYKVSSVDEAKLIIDSVSEADGVIFFRAKNGSIGYQTIEIELPVTGATITRHYCIKVSEL